MHIQGAPLAVAGGCLALAAVAWRWRLPRVVAVLAGITAFCGWFAFPDAMTALVAKAATSTAWLTGLIVATAIGGCALVIEAFVARRYHPVATPFLMTTFGISAATDYAGWPQISKGGAKLLPQAGHAISAQAAQIRAQQFTQPPSAAVAHQQTTYLIAAAVVVVVFFFVLHRIHVKRKNAGMTSAKPIMRQGVLSLFRRSKKGPGKAVAPGDGNMPAPAGRGR